MDATRAVELAPDWPKGYLRMVHALQIQGDEDRAHQALETAIKSFPTDPTLAAERAAFDRRRLLKVTKDLGSSAAGLQSMLGNMLNMCQDINSQSQRRY